VATLGSGLAIFRTKQTDILICETAAIGFGMGGHQVLVCNRRLELSAAWREVEPPMGLSGRSSEVIQSAARSSLVTKTHGSSGLLTETVQEVESASSALEWVRRADLDCPRLASQVVIVCFLLVIPHNGVALKNSCSARPGCKWGFGALGHIFLNGKQARTRVSSTRDCYSAALLE
jgi:hypothetical protein